MTIAKTLKVLLGIQLSLYAITMSILFFNRDSTTGLESLDALLPLGVCMLLAPIVGILLVIYAIAVKTKRSPSDNIVWLLAGAMITLIVLYGPIVNLL